MGDAARKINPEEVIDTEGVDVTNETPVSENDNTPAAEVIDMEDYRKKKEAAKRAQEDADLDAELAEAGSVAEKIAGKVTDVMENPTVRKYMKKVVNVADDVCQNSINKVWNEMPDEVKWGIMYYPATAVPDPYIMSFQTLAKCGMLDMPENFSEEDYVKSSLVLAEKVAKYGKRIYAELKVADKLVELATKVNWLMDASFYRHIRSMVQEKRAQEGTMAANDNNPQFTVDETPEAPSQPITDEVQAEQVSMEEDYKKILDEGDQKAA